MRTFDPDEYDRWLERFKRKKAYSWQIQKPPVVLWSSVPEPQRKFVREPVEEEKCCAALPCGDFYSEWHHYYFIGKQVYRRCEAPRGKSSPFCQAHERMVAARGMRKEE